MKTVGGKRQPENLPLSGNVYGNLGGGGDSD